MTPEKRMNMEDVYFAEIYQLWMAVQHGINANEKGEVDKGLHWCDR